MRGHSVGRQAVLVVGEHAAATHSMTASRDPAMAVDLQADVLLAVAEAVQQRGVRFRRQDRRWARVAAERGRGTALRGRPRRPSACEGWSSLAGTCTASWPSSVSAAVEPGQERLVVRASSAARRWRRRGRTPPSRGERRRCPSHEAEPVAGERRGPGQHRRRAVDADGLPRRQAPVQLAASARRCRSPGRPRASPAGAAPDRAGRRTAAPARRGSARTVRGSTVKVAGWQGGRVAGCGWWVMGGGWWVSVIAAIPSAFVRSVSRNARFRAFRPYPTTPSPHHPATLPPIVKHASLSVR